MKASEKEHLKFSSVLLYISICHRLILVSALEFFRSKSKKSLHSFSPVQSCVKVNSLLILIPFLFSNLAFVYLPTYLFCLFFAFTSFFPIQDVEFLSDMKIRPQKNGRRRPFAPECFSEDSLMTRICASSSSRRQRA